MAQEPIRVLILEDNPADAELIQFELEEAGLAFSSKVVMTEEDFIREIQEFSPDLILSDYDLPKYNGALALTEARRLCPDTPFILVTGAIVEDRAIDILTKGAKDYVLKNRLHQRLVPAIRRALSEAVEHRARKQAESELREAHDVLEAKVKERTAALEAEIENHKHTEEALRQSLYRERERAEELTVLLDSVPTPVFIVHDPDSLHMTGNRAADDLLRNPPGAEASLSAPSELKPRHFKAIKDGRELKIDELPAQRAARGEEIKNFDFDLVFDDGTTRHVLGYGTPLHDETGLPRGAVHVLVDITERQQVEEKLRAMLENIRRNEERLNLALAAARMATWDWHVPSGVVVWNDTHYRMMGYEPGEVQPTYQAWANRVHPDDIDSAQSKIQQCMAERQIYVNEFRTLWPDGTIRHLEARGEFEYDANNQPLRCYGVMLDTTERQQVEAEIRSLTKRLG